MLEPPEPPPFDRSLMPQHPWEKPAIYAANFALGFFIIVIVVFTILGQLPDPKPKAGAESKKGAKSKHGQYTKDEVAKHNKADDAWLIIDGKVYDVTSYVEEHPGGNAILRNVGGDCSKGFHGPQHPTRVYEMMDEYEIGTLIESDKDK